MHFPPVVEMGVHLWASRLGRQFSITYLLVFDVGDGECGVSWSAERHDGNWLLRGDLGGVPKSFFMMKIEELFAWLRA
ncbi:hypothetical protein TNCV_4044061 [Trichonephila clavipes]|nr:hypothetical protein TNCV_4044061 [Trichonephila clavipes]